MSFFAFLIAVSLFIEFVKGAYYYMRTVIDESANGMSGNNFQGGWVDSLGTAYFVKPNIRAIQRLTPDGNTSLIIGPSSQSLSGASAQATSVIRWH
jgi:hypothetical protein